jgi:hypothetical protein
MGRRRDRSYKYSVRACLELKPVKGAQVKHLYLGTARKQGLRPLVTWRQRPESRIEDLVENIHFVLIDDPPRCLY